MFPVVRTHLEQISDTDVTWVTLSEVPFWISSTVPEYLTIRQFVFWHFYPIPNSDHDISVHIVTQDSITFHSFLWHFFRQKTNQSVLLNHFHMQCLHLKPSWTLLYSCHMHLCTLNLSLKAHYYSHRAWLVLWLWLKIKIFQDLPD